MSDLGALSRRIDALARSLPPLVHAISPTNWSEEVARLSEAFVRNIHTDPRFRYRPPQVDPALPDRLEELLGGVPSATPEGRALAARVAGLVLELRLLLAVGTPRLAELARRRFACSASEDERAASWAGLSPERDEEEEILSDSGDGRSLLSVARREVAARRLPVRVVVREGLSSLAAFGGGVLLVASGRRVGACVAQRTALHEVLGHALPWWERQREQRWLDPEQGDQEEGAALLVEERAGMLDAGRKKELGLRHVAARMVHEGEPFARLVQYMESMNISTPEAVRIAARVSRGGGVGRERVYLPWFWRQGGGPNRDFSK